MTPALLATCTGAHTDRAVLFAPLITAAMAEFGIDSPTQQAAFLAQVGHESGGLRYTVELWGPTDAQVRYEGRADLGNVHPGDGFKYRGRGLLQVTGRDNYRRVGQALGVDLEASPQLLGEPELAARSAGHFWQSHSLNEIADAGDFVRLTRRINGGTNGLDDRERLWASAKTAMVVA